MVRSKKMLSPIIMNGLLMVYKAIFVWKRFKLIKVFSLLRENPRTYKELINHGDIYRVSLLIVKQERIPKSLVLEVQLQLQKYLIYCSLIYSNPFTKKIKLRN